MESSESHKREEILKVGISLDAIGVNNWALTKSQALTALEQFFNRGIPILGGDVCENVNGTIKHNYDNWYCDPLAEEAKGDYVIRSINKARAYIEEYKSKQPDKIFFILVPGT